MKKQGKGLYIVVIALAVVIVLCGSACIYGIVSQNIPSLNPSKHEGKQEEADVDLEGTDIQQNMNGFTVSSNGSVTEAPQANGDEENLDSANYLCSFSSEREMKKSDVKDIIKKNKETLPKGKSMPQMLINEIYARHGCKFETKEVQEYFDKKDWYKDLSEYESDKGKIYDEMSKTEKKNIKLLQNYK